MAQAHHGAGMRRDPWQTAWHGTVWERLVGGRWRPVLSADTSAGEVLLISAWNPRGRRLGAGANRSRDAVLRRDLARLGLPAVRIRGRSVDGSWHEEGWLIPHRPGLDVALIRGHGQWAALLIRRDRRHLLWCDGRTTRDA
jgi:hypothetical protein